MKRDMGWNRSCDLNLEHASFPIPNWNTGSVMYHISIVRLILMILVTVKDSFYVCVGITH